MFESLLDSTIPINIDLLDQCVQKLYQTGDNRCKEICDSLLNRPDSFGIVDQILESPRSFYLKVYALTIFSNFVQLRWETVPIDNKTQFRNFIAQFINNITSNPDPNLTDNNRQYLARYANLVLLNILKYDWPQSWPNFIPDILEASHSSPSMCANTFFILQSLAQEFTEFAENSLSSNRQGEMSSTFILQFPLIIPVIELALASTDNPDLVNSVLTSLKYFIKAIDPTIIFNSKIFSTICDTLLPDIRYTINCIGVFGEIAANPCLPTDISTIILQLFRSIVSCLGNFFPIQFEINGRIHSEGVNLYKINVPKPNEFVHIFTASMTSYVTSFQDILANSDNAEPYLIMLKWLFNVTENAPIDDLDFLLCVQMWHSICRSIYTECITSNLPYSPVYTDILYHLRRLAIRRMACPTEVIYVIDDTGIHSRRESVTSQSTNLYNCMREMFVYLTHIDHSDMISALFEKVEEIKSSSAFTVDQINSLCWAAGSVGGGALTEVEESNFFTSILEYLLQLFKSISDIMMRANVASGIMYVCSQFGRFLSDYWSLLKVVMQKLFEFMNEIEIPLVQDSVVQSMKSLVKLCSNLLVTKQPDEESSYLEMMLRNAPTILASLSLDNIVEMYEIFSILIQKLRNDEERESMTSLISSSLNGDQNGLVSLASNIQPFDENWLNQFTLIIKCNKKMSKFLGYTYYSQLKEIIPTLIQIYSKISEGIQEVAPDTSQFAILMGIKAMIVKLLTTAVRMCGKPQYVADVVLPPSVQAFMPDYANSAVGKTPEILSLFANLTMKLHSEIISFIPQIMSSLVNPTLPYLTNYTLNYAYWKNFTILALSLVQLSSFLTAISKEEVNTFMEYLKLCCNHPQIEISVKGLQALLDLLSVPERGQNVQFFNEFLDFYGLNLMQFVMNLLTDSVHRYAFTFLIGLARKLSGTNAVKSRQVELFQILTDMFPNRPASDIKELIEKMIMYSQNFMGYKDTMRNFLISAKKYAVNDPALYAKEKEEIAEQIRNKAKVPGLLKPSESPEVQANIGKLVDTVLNFKLFK